MVNFSVNSILLSALCIILLCIGWTAFTIGDAINSWTRRPLAAPEQTQEFFDVIVQKATEASPGNISIVLIEDGVVLHEHYASLDEGFTGDSVFQVASLSKWLTAWGVLSLVERGKIELNVPVSAYLSRWSLPDSIHNDEVTVERLLSHTAGFADDLGYMGFDGSQGIQTLQASLTKSLDAKPGVSGAAGVVNTPGATWRYSGASYTLLQLIIEEVSGLTFDNYMKQAIFEPLGMQRSTFILETRPDMKMAPIYDEQMQVSAHRTFTATGAASLFTTTDDLAKFLVSQIEFEAPAFRAVLSGDIIRQLRRPYARHLGFDLWGLGVVLYADVGGDYIYGHDGGNAPAISTTARINPATRDGIIILTSGKKNLARILGDEWLVWQGGKIGLSSLSLMADRLSKQIFIGWGVILILSAIFFIRKIARGVDR